MVPSPRARLAEPGLTAEMERKKAASMTRLQRAQQYRERTHLPRYYKSTDWPPRQIKCQPRTPHASSQLFDVWKDNIHPSFGIGVSSYFRLLRNIGLLGLLCGIINIPSAHYYHSRGYSSVKYAAVKEHSAFEINERKQNSYLLANTALCGNYIPVCLDSSCTRYSANCHEDEYWSEIRFEEYPVCHEYEGEIQKIYKFRFLFDEFKTELLGHRECEIKAWQGYCDMAMTVFIIIVIAAMNYYDKRTAKIIRAENPDVTMCSLCVENPEESAADPEQWHDYFRHFGEVTSVTVCLKNGRMLELLREKRRIEAQLLLQSPDGVLPGGKYVEPIWSQKLRRIGLLPLCPPQVQINDLERRIHDLALEGLHAMTPIGVSKVFVVFKTETEMRRCVQYLHYFKQGTVVVSNAAPTDSIFYCNIELSSFRKGLAFGATTFAMLCICFGSFRLLEFILFKGYRSLMTMTLVAITELLPILTRLLTNLERHHTTSSYETSYLLKSVPSHWFTACFIPWYISDFTEHNDTHVFYHIIDVLLLHAVSKPLFHMIDPIGLVKRKIVARFAKTDRAVKALYAGKRWTLSKRYVDITTNVMICFIYGSVMPLIYFILALTCLLTYWADKYCLFRVNAELPPTDEHLGMLIYVYLCISVAIHMLFTLWFFGSWPFDQVCPIKEALDEEGLEIANTYGLDKDSSWEVCNQNFFRIQNLHLGEHLWWSKSQKKFIYLYVWVVAGAATTWLVWFFTMRYLAYRARLQKLKEKISDGKFSTSLDDLPDNKTREYLPHINIPGEDLPVQAAFYAGSISSEMNDRRLPFLEKIKASKNLFYDSSLQSIDIASRQRLFSRIMITDMDKKQNMRQRKISSREKAKKVVSFNESDSGNSEESKMEIETENPMLQNSGISGTQSLSVDHTIYRIFGVDRRMWNGL